MRNRHADPPVELKLSIPKSLAVRLDLILFDPVRGKPQYGARSKLVQRLIREYLSEATRKQKEKAHDQPEPVRSAQGDRAAELNIDLEARITDAERSIRQSQYDASNIAIRASFAEELRQAKRDRAAARAARADPDRDPGSDLPATDGSDRPPSEEGS